MFEDASEDFEEDEEFVDAREEPEEERGVKRKREVVTILFLVFKALVHLCVKKDADGDDNDAVKATGIRIR